MNKLSKILLVLFLVFLFGSCFGFYFVQAQNNNLILEATKKCDIQYTGDSCVAELKLTNNTDEILDGEVSLHIDYRGVCGDGSFDGEGIQVWYNNSSSSNWNNGDLTFSNFNILKGESYPKLKIETVPALCPGEYIFSLELKGTKAGEEYPTSPIIISGGGGGGGYSFARVEEQEKEEPAESSLDNQTGEEEEEPAEEFEEVRPLENSGEEVVRGRTSSEAEEGVGEQEEEEEKEEERLLEIPSFVEIQEAGEQGLGWLFAAIGDLFRLENLWWLLLLLIIIIIILYWLSRKKKRKE